MCELIIESLDALLDRDEVREESAEPPLIHEMHSRALGFLGDRLLRLLLRSDEEDLPTVGGEVPHEDVGLFDTGERLLKIDDVDAVALHEDEALHLWIPAASLMSEVNPGLQELRVLSPARGRALAAPSPPFAAFASRSAAGRGPGAPAARAQPARRCHPQPTVPSLPVDRPRFLKSLSPRHVSCGVTRDRWLNTTKRPCRVAPLADGKCSCPKTPRSLSLKPTGEARRTSERSTGSCCPSRTRTSARCHSFPRTRTFCAVAGTWICTTRLGLTSSRAATRRSNRDSTCSREKRSPPSSGMSSFGPVTVSSAGPRCGAFGRRSSPTLGTNRSARLSPGRSPFPAEGATR